MMKIIFFFLIFKEIQRDAFYVLTLIALNISSQYYLKIDIARNRKNPETSAECSMPSGYFSPVTHMYT